MPQEATELDIRPNAEADDRESMDHRTIVGRRRRVTTETKIIRAAVRVFAEQGLDAPVIDDFIRAAGIARGTFYNYFKSVDELLRATCKVLSEEMIELIDGEVQPLKDPAIRFGMGMRLWMRWVQANPSWCLFIARVWNSVKYERPLQDIREGIRKKVFVAPNAFVAWDMVSGAIRQAMFRISEGNVQHDYGELVAQMCLAALGASSETMDEVLSLPLPEMPTLGS